MTYIHYNEKTGEFIHAYHDSCSDIPTPNISVSDEEWSPISTLTTKRIDLTTLKLVYDDAEPNNIIINNSIGEIDCKISEIETKTYRPLREIALGLDTDGTSASKLADYQSQIEALRTERATLKSQLA